VLLHEFLQILKIKFVSRNTKAIASQHSTAPFVCVVFFYCFIVYYLFFLLPYNICFHELMVNYVCASVSLCSLLSNLCIICRINGP
jgi:hypothetical protein